MLEQIFEGCPNTGNITDLFKWLYNKPRCFTKHSIEKINLVIDIKQVNVKYVESTGQYILVNSSINGKRYKTNLGTQNTFP